MVGFGRFTENHKIKSYYSLQLATEYHYVISQFLYDCNQTKKIIAVQIDYFPLAFSRGSIFVFDIFEYLRD